MKEFQAEVVDVRDQGVLNGQRRWQLLLSETQLDGVEGVLVAVSPSGARLEVPVFGVVVEGFDVWHVVEKPLAAGTSVTGTLYGGDERSG